MPDFPFLSFSPSPIGGEERDSPTRSGGCVRDRQTRTKAGGKGSAEVDRDFVWASIWPFILRD